MSIPAVPGQYGYSHRARVLKAGALPNTWMVSIPAVAPGSLSGPMPSLAPDITVGDLVLVNQVGTTRGDLVIVGKIPGAFPPYADLPGLSAALATKANQTDLTTLTTRVGTDEAMITANGTAITTLQGRATTDEAAITANGAAIASNGSAITANGTAITALQARATADEVNITLLLALSVVCTSTTRPATPTAMTIIYETDTGYVYLWSGSAWLWIAATVLPKARFHASAGSNQTLGATNNAVQFGVTDQSHADVVASGTGNTILTVGRAGWWAIDVGNRISDTAAGNRFTQIMSSDFATTMYKSQSALSQPGTSSTDFSLSWSGQLAIGAAISVNAVASATASIDHSSGNAPRTSIALTWIRP